VGEVPLDEVTNVKHDDFPEAFSRAMDSDVNVAGALAAIHEAVKAGNNALSAGDSEAVRKAQLDVRAMLDVLGLDPLAEPWRSGRAGGAQGGASAERKALDALVPSLLEARAEARANKDWAAADAIRDQLSAAGITVEDSAQGARWSLG
ncbi:MAG: cysteine--tRNA ligase, partial [Actinomycetaceae bacterium]|nr:cysteine--tRNA ligase [Actinomycetaceae bacterium]